MAQTNILSPFPHLLPPAAPDQPAYKDGRRSGRRRRSRRLIEVMEILHRSEVRAGWENRGVPIENEDPVMAGQPIVAIEKLISKGHAAL